MIKRGNKSRVTCYIKIAVFVAIEYAAIAAVHLRTFRNVYVQQFAFAITDFINCQIARWIKLLRVVDGCGKVFFYLLYRGWLNAGNFARIVYSQKNVAAMTVGKSTDRLVNITIQGIATFFKLDCQTLALLDKTADKFSSFYSYQNKNHPRSSKILQLWIMILKMQFSDRKATCTVTK